MAPDLLYELIVAASLTWVGPFGASETHGPYFARRLPVAIIFAAFFALTLPLAGVALAAPAWLEKSRLGFFYFIVVGNTHFLLTFALYLQVANRRYFAETRARTVIYWVIPILIFLFFDLYRALGVAAAWPALDAGLSALIRLLNFHHWGRQAYGVGQLLKRRSPVPFVGAARGFESAHYHLMTVLMALTYFTGGRLATTFFPTAFLLGVAVVSTVICTRLLMRSREAVGYLLAQTASAALAVYSAPLYVFSLAMHYVEYHVVMYPRVFSDERLRAHRGLFYLVLVNVAIISSALIATAGGHVAAGPSLMLALFDGLFVCHYFIEAFVWRFSDPHYRRALALYFGGR